MVFGFSQYRDLPERVPIDWSPALLMTGGPYAISRHPMYVGELALWLGWAILYGSIPVLIGFAVLGAVVLGSRHGRSERWRRSSVTSTAGTRRESRGGLASLAGIERQAEPGAAPDRRGT